MTEHSTVEGAPEPSSAEDDLTTLPGWDSLADDLIGFNFKSVRGMRDACLAPRKYMIAASDPGWLGRYTPAMKLALLLVALTSFLRFLWAGPESSLVENYRIALDLYKDSLNLPPTTEMAGALLTKMLLLFPFFYVTFHGLMSLALFIWGRNTNAPLRMRRYFVALIPALVLGVASTFLLAVLPHHLYGLATNSVFAILILIYFVTVWRGLPQALAPRGRFARAAGFAIIATMIDTIVTASSLVAAVVWQTMTYATQ